MFAHRRPPGTPTAYAAATTTTMATSARPFRSAAKGASPAAVPEEEGSASSSSSPSPSPPPRDKNPKERRGRAKNPRRTPSSSSSSSTPSEPEPKCCDDDDDDDIVTVTRRQLQGIKVAIDEALGAGDRKSATVHIPCSTLNLFLRVLVDSGAKLCVKA